MSSHGHVVRDSCDECHSRKVRCIASTNSCQACCQYGRRCVFSARSKMGRPRTRRRKTIQETSPLRPKAFKGLDWSTTWSLPPTPSCEHNAAIGTDTATYNPLEHFSAQQPGASVQNYWPLDYTSMQGTYQETPHYPR